MTRRGAWSAGAEFSDLLRHAQLRHGHDHEESAKPVLPEDADHGSIGAGYLASAMILRSSCGAIGGWPWAGSPPGELSAVGRPYK
jgi:hypothetical protein